MSSQGWSASIVPNGAAQQVARQQPHRHQGLGNAVLLRPNVTPGKGPCDPRPPHFDDYFRLACLQLREHEYMSLKSHRAVVEKAIAHIEQQVTEGLEELAKCPQASRKKLFIYKFHQVLKLTQVELAWEPELQGFSGKEEAWLRVAAAHPEAAEVRSRLAAIVNLIADLARIWRYADTTVWAGLGVS
jgi:hypothetical protein